MKADGASAKEIDARRSVRAPDGPKQAQPANPN
jgi:hypothetical protein